MQSPTEDTNQYIKNKSFDPTFQLSQVEAVGYDASAGVMRPIAVDASGSVRATFAKRSELDGRVKMIKSGTDVFIRTKWTSQWVGDYDLIQKMTLVTDTNWDNNAVNFGYIGILPTTTSDADVPTTSYTSNYQQITDDTCPLYLNGTYIGGNHGISWAVQVTVTGHDKTTVDEGSQWKSAAAHVFTLMRVVDENTIVLMTNNYGVDGKWNFYKWFSGSVLYHVSGATHTGNMTFSGAATHALKPSIKNHTRKVYINDTEVTDDGVYYAGSCDIVHTYDVNDAPSMVAYAQANIGNVDFTDASIENVGRVTITYRYHENGSCTVYQSFRALKALELGYVGFVQQAAVVIPTSGTLYQYVPKMADFTIGANTYTLKSTHNITSLANTLDLTTARWTSASAPPDRFFQYSKNSDGSNYYGMAVGYNRIGLGDPATRAANCSSAGQIATSKKVYPKLATGLSTTWADSMVPAGTVFDGVAFRCPINYEDHPNATNVSWYYLNDDCYLMIDYHSALSEYVALPDCLVGRKIEVIETDGITVGSEYVTHDGIYVTSAAYGTAVLRLYKEDLTLLTGYVPYLGATTDVDLGANNLLAKQVGIDSTPDRPLTIDTANSAVPAGEGSVMIYGGVNKERVEIRSAGGEPAFQSKRAGGTWAVPTKSILGARLFSLGAGGHDGTDWVAGAKGIIALYAAEAWEAGKNGTYFSVGLTPIGSSTRGDVFRIQNDGKVGIKTSAPDRMLEINTGAATDGIRISYNDGNGSATTYGDILLDSSGYMTISPTGNSLTIDADVDLGSEDLTTNGAITGLSGNFTALYVNTDDFYVDGGKIGIATDTPSTKIDIWSDITEEIAPIGDQWLTGGSWTVPTGWTDNGDGTFTHAGAATDALVYNKNATVNQYYFVNYAIAGRTTGTLTISIGGQGTSSVTATSSYGPKASTTANLTITPVSSFDGTISISVFQLSTYPAIETITDSYGVVSCERRSSDSAANTYIGTNVGRYSRTAYNCTGFGNGALASITTAHNSTAVGSSALTNQTYGVYNTALGSSALYNLTYGAYNTALGYQALYNVKTGSHNVGIGYAALFAGTGTGNIAIGALALGTTTGSYNIGLGFSAGRYTKGSYEFYVNYKDQGDTATEKANSLMFGVMGAAAKDQTLALNVASLTVNAGVDTDVTMNFTGTTNSGVYKWMEDEDYFEFDDDIYIAGGENIVLSGTTGTKIGTATTQLLGFYNATPVNQPDTVADADGSLGSATTTINTIIDRLQELGLIA